MAEMMKAKMTNCDGSCGGANSADMATITLQLGLITGTTQTVTTADSMRKIRNKTMQITQKCILLFSETDSGDGEVGAKMADGGSYACAAQPHATCFILIESSHHPADTNITSGA